LNKEKGKGHCPMDHGWALPWKTEGRGSVSSRGGRKKGHVLLQEEEEKRNASNSCPAKRRRVPSERKGRGKKKEIGHRKFRERRERGRK